MSARIFDAHIHCSEAQDDLLIPYARFNGLEYTLGELLSEMETENIEGGLLLSPPLKGGGIFPNDGIIDLCNRSRGKLLPILTVEPSRDAVNDALELARKYRGKVKGFKMRLGYVEVFASDPVFSPIYDYAESVNLPVLFHTGDTATSSGSLAHSHPLTLDSLANKREELKIIACHFGNPWIGDVAELIYKHPNVYTDISGLFTGREKEASAYGAKFLDSLVQKVSEAIYFAGSAEKVLFGTDYPVEAISSAISFAKRLKIEEEDRSKIFFDNARRVFSL